MPEPVDYFSMRGPATHIVAAPTSETRGGVARARWSLLVQGEARDIRYQVTPRSETFRLLLGKEAVVGAGLPAGELDCPARFTLVAGSRVVLAPCAGPRTSTFSQTAVLVDVATSTESALACAMGRGHLLLVCEVLHIAEDGAQAEWVRWENGCFELPPWPTAPGPGDR